MPVATVKYSCGHEVTRTLPKHDFEPGKDGKTFLQRAAELQCKACRGAGEYKTVAEAEKPATKAKAEAKAKATTPKRRAASARKAAGEGAQRGQA